MIPSTNDNPGEDKLREILGSNPVIAVVGLSPKPDRDSHQVAKYLLQHGYRIIPVHPKADEILGQKAYPDLASIPKKIDIVDVFRRPEYCEPIAQAAVEAGAKVLWLQSGIRNEQAASIAAHAGLTVIQDRCIKIDHHRLAKNL